MFRHRRVLNQNRMVSYRYASTDGNAKCNGWDCSASTEGYREQDGYLACFDGLGSLSNVGFTHGIRSFEVHLATGLAVLERGLIEPGGSIRYTAVTVALKDVSYSFDTYHPDYFRLRFPAGGSVISMGISYSSSCSSDALDVALCLTPYWPDGVSNTDRDVYIQSESIFGDDDFHPMDYEGPNDRFVISFPNLGLCVYSYRFYAIP